MERRTPVILEVDLTVEQFHTKAVADEARRLMLNEVIKETKVTGAGELCDLYTLHFLAEPQRYSDKHGVIYDDLAPLKGYTLILSAKPKEEYYVL